jgi:hypothetical protein
VDFNPATTAHSGDTSIDSGVSRDWSGGSTEFDAGTSTSASGGSASVAAAYEFNPPEKLESFDFSEKKMRLGGENGGRTGKSFYCNCQPVLLFITNPIFSALKASDDNRALAKSMVSLASKSVLSEYWCYEKSEHRFGKLRVSLLDKVTMPLSNRAEFKSVVFLAWFWIGVKVVFYGRNSIVILAPHVPTRWFSTHHSSR